MQEKVELFQRKVESRESRDKKGAPNRCPPFLTMTLIIAFELEAPQIRFHGLFAARLVFLSLEGCALLQLLCAIRCWPCLTSGQRRGGLGLMNKIDML